MRARSIVASSAVAVLTTTAFLTPAASAAAAGGKAQGGSYDAGSCGRLDTHIRPDGALKLKVGKPKRFAIAFASERPCNLAVFLRPMGRERGDGGLVVAPAQYVPVTTPATIVWTITGTRKDDGLLAAYITGSGASFGIRLNDVVVR